MSSRIPTDTTDGTRARRRSWRGATAAGLSLLLFAGITYGGWRLLHTSPKPRPAACPTSSPAALAPTLAVRVLNGTGQRRLAGQTADVLRKRGFRIAAVGNAARLRGRSEVRYGSRDVLTARLTALQVPSVRLVADRTVAKRIDLVLGDGFRRLRTTAEIAVATKKAKLPRPRPASTPSCR